MHRSICVGFSSAKKTEMLFNQRGICVVDRGIDAKIKNIVYMENAKARLLADQRNKKTRKKKKDYSTSFGTQKLSPAQPLLSLGYERTTQAPQMQKGAQSKATAGA